MAERPHLVVIYTHNADGSQTGRTWSVPAEVADGIAAGLGVPLMEMLLSREQLAAAERVLPPTPVLFGDDG